MSHSGWICSWSGCRRVVWRFESAIAFWIAAAFSLTNWLWGFFVVPESLPLDRRKPFELKRANPVGSLVLLRSHHELWRLATIQFLAYLAHNVFSIWTLYAIYRFKWSQGMVGLSLAVVGACAVVVSGGLTGIVVARLGERRTLYISQFFGACGMFCAGLARNGALFLASIPVISLWNMSMPAAQAIMTRRVSEREQGELQGALGSLRSITFLIGPGLFSLTYGWFIDPKHSLHIPGAPYFLAALLLLTAMVMSTRIEQPKPAKDLPVSPPPPRTDVVPPDGVGSAIPPDV